MKQIHMQKMAAGLHNENPAEERNQPALRVLDFNKNTWYWLHPLLFLAIYSRTNNPAALCKIAKMHICEYHDHKEA